MSIRLAIPRGISEPDRLRNLPGKREHRFPESVPGSGGVRGGSFPSLVVADSWKMQGDVVMSCGLAKSCSIRFIADRVQVDEERSNKAVSFEALRRRRDTHFGFHVEPIPCKPPPDRPRTRRACRIIVT